ncbi:MAG: YiiX/YebB-like N1pC/P60 family cysteine hydrolase [Bacteroidota bacterium]
MKRKRFLAVVGSILLLPVLLLVPERDPEIVKQAGRTPFIWNQDAYWSALEARFREVRREDCPSLQTDLQARFTRVEGYLDLLNGAPLSIGDSLYGRLELELFELATILAACPDELPGFVHLTNRLRSGLKWQSRRWDMNSDEVRNSMYRLLYGSRAAIEEVMLQAPAGTVPELVVANQEPSGAPSATILGLKVHSGDILVSRGGAPTSALIARGNDYPGNFSHVAMLHVDSTTGEASLIESHIERGVAIATVDEYLRDVKLRILVLRLRHDLPALQQDPLLPHKAATLCLEEAQGRHIPYDFSMDYNDDSEMFCSEVASAAYGGAGIRLWMGVSNISGKGLVSWLSALGVRHFETQEPSDLEYDPQLRVLAEWRDKETLFKDHLDNAVIDAMLEEADEGQSLEYDWYLLPVARLAKGYSVLLNLMGQEGPVPEGMSATVALRAQWFSSQHERRVEYVRTESVGFQERHGYRPPYWVLMRMARTSREVL